jgi:hypothetical protein
MDEEQKKREPKISLVEALLIGAYIGTLDVIDIIPTAGDITDLLGAPIMFYLNIKGVGGMAFIIAEIMDLFPIVQEFPSRSVAWLIIIGLDRFAPAKLEEAVEKAGELAAAKGAGAAPPEAGAPEGIPEEGTSTEEAAPEKPEVKPEELGEEPTPFEKLQELLEKLPEEEAEGEEEETEEEIPTPTGGGQEITAAPRAGEKPEKKTEGPKEGGML